MNKEFLEIKPKDLKILLKFGKRSDTVKGFKSKELIYHTFENVKTEIPNLLNEGDIDAVILILTKRKGVRIKEGMPFMLWVYDEIKRIGELEKQYLSSTPDADMINAGIETLNELGELNTKDAVAQRFGYKIEEVEQMPYWKVFNLQRKMKLEGDIQKNMIRIQKDKSKRKNGYI